MKSYGWATAGPMIDSTTNPNKTTRTTREIPYSPRNTRQRLSLRRKRAQEQRLEEQPASPILEEEETKKPKLLHKEDSSTSCSSSSCEGESITSETTIHPLQIVAILGRTSTNISSSKNNNKNMPPSPSKKPKRNVKKNVEKENNNNKSSSTKSVSFKCNKKGQIKTRVRTIAPYKRPHDVWWSEDEMDSFRRKVREQVKEFENEHDYLWALATLYQSHRPHIMERDLERASQIFLAHHSVARGMETYISETAYGHVDHHQQQIIASTSNNKNNNKKKQPMNPSLLRRESRASSKASRMFAVAMAELDAQEAAVAYACQ